MSNTNIPYGAKARIAVAAGVSRNTVSSWFTGKHSPVRNRQRVVDAVVSVLGYCPDLFKATPAE